MAQSVMGKIEELSAGARATPVREGTHHADAADRERLATDRPRPAGPWDLRRRELAGERVDLDEDFFDRFTVTQAATHRAGRSVSPREAGLKPAPTR